MGLAEQYRQAAERGAHDEAAALADQLAERGRTQGGTAGIRWAAKATSHRRRIPLDDGDGGAPWSPEDTMNEYTWLAEPHPDTTQVGRLAARHLLLATSKRWADRRDALELVSNVGYAVKHADSPVGRRVHRTLVGLQWALSGSPDPQTGQQVEPWGLDEPAFLDRYADHLASLAAHTPQANDAAIALWAAAGWDTTEWRRSWFVRQPEPRGAALMTVEQLRGSYVTVRTTDGATLEGTLLNSTAYTLTMTADLSGTGVVDHVTLVDRDRIVAIGTPVDSLPLDIADTLP